MNAKISSSKMTALIGITAVAVAILLPVLLTPWEVLDIQRQYRLRNLPPLATYFVKDLFGERLVVLSQTVVPEGGATSRIVLSPIWMRPSGAERRLIECSELRWNCGDARYALANDPRGVINWWIFSIEFLIPILAGTGLIVVTRRSKK